MGENSKIEWCHHTFNAWRGCTKVSEGCAHCYAETLSKRNPKVLGEWGPGKPRVLASEAMWKEPLKWDREAAAAWENWERAVDARAGDSGPMPERPRVFCSSLADWLDDEVPIGWFVRLLELIHATPNLDWLLLTKRPENWRKRLEKTDYEIIFTTADFVASEWLAGRPPANVWIGASVENQGRAEERIPLLLPIPAKVRFLSCEPLLAAVDFSTTFRWQRDDMAHQAEFSPVNRGIHWVICGGESGPEARPMHPDWARSLRDQCAAAGVPFFFKQWGEWGPQNDILMDPERAYEKHRIPIANCVWRVGKKKAGRLLDGREWNQFPQVEGRSLS